MSAQRPTRLGKFELQARIAKGGMAEIYLARQEGIGLSRLAVVKRILPHLLDEAGFVQMFLEEARLAAQISHPNVVQIYDVGEEDGDFYIAMEYIEGPSVGLIARRARNTEIPLPPLIAAELVAQTCDGLHAAHELKNEDGMLIGLVHRDVSPHNLMISPAGTVKLLDFGVAKAHDSAVKTNTGSVKGKFPYMSPEQCRGEDLDRRTDIFSLGAVFYELLTAKRLFQRPTDLMILKAITEEAIDDPRQYNPALPEEFVDVLFRALVRDRNYRYATAEEFGIDIREAIVRRGEHTSPKMLNDYVQEHFGEELSARSEKLRGAVRKPTGAYVPTVTGLDAGRSHSSQASISSSYASLHSHTPHGASVELANLIVSDDTLQETDPTEVQPQHSNQSKQNLTRTKMWIIGTVLISLITAVGIFFFLKTRAPGPKGPALTFGTAPIYDPATINKELLPFTKYLEQKTNRKINLRVTEEYRQLRSDLLNGKIQFAWVSPLQFVRLRAEQPAVRVLATTTQEGSKYYQGYLVIKTKGSIKTLDDLRGKRICYVDKGSASGYLMARYFLRSKGINPNDLLSRFSGNHSQVLRDLQNGLCDVGATFNEAYGTLSVEETKKVKILAITTKIPTDTICASPTLSANMRHSLRKALLDFRPTRDLKKTVIGERYPIDSFIKPDLSIFSKLEQADKEERASEEQSNDKNDENAKSK